jgi:hypothetical protein
VAASKHPFFSSGQSGRKGKVAATSVFNGISDLGEVMVGQGWILTRLEGQEVIF